MNQAELIFFVVQLWSLIGVIVAIPFLFFGIDRIDSSSRGSYAFRLLLVPGVILLWPLVLWRWFNLERGRDSWQHFYNPPRRHHGIAAIFLALLVALRILVSLIARPTWTDYEPERLSSTATYEILL